MHFMRAIGWFMDGNEWWQLRSCLRAAVGGRKGSRVRDGWEADKTAPPAFPNSGHGQRLILQFTMPFALRLVNDTTEYVVENDWSVFQQNLFVARNFSSLVSCHVWSWSGGTVRRMQMLIPTLALFLAALALCSLKQDGVQSVEKSCKSSREKVSCGLEITLRVHTTILRKLLDAGATLSTRA